MILSKKDLKILIETVLKEQDQETQENNNDEGQEEQEASSEFEEIKFYIPKKFISKLIDTDEIAKDGEEIEVVIKDNGGNKIIYEIDGIVPPDITPIKVMTIVGVGMIYGVDESGEKEKIANRLKDILVLDKNFKMKSLGRMKEILAQKIKLSRLNFSKEKIKDAFNL